MCVLSTHGRSRTQRRCERETRTVMGYLRKAWAVAAKDLRVELRAKETLSVMIAFAVLAVVIFGLAFDLRVADARWVVPGVLWSTLFFVGVLGVQRSFGAEADRGSLTALLLAPVERSALYLGKLIANFVFLLLTALLLIPLLLIFFDQNLLRPALLLALLLGVLGYAAVGTFFAALTASLRSRETLLPVMLLPTLVPLFMAGLAATNRIVDRGAEADISGPLLLLLLFDLIFVTAAFLVFDLIWDEAE